MKQYIYRLLITIIILNLISCANNIKDHKIGKKKSSTKTLIQKRNFKKKLSKLSPSDSSYFESQELFNNFQEKEDIKINLQDPEINNKETELVDYSALFDHDEIVDENGNYNANFKVGNPYIVEGKHYQPKTYESYQETGKASWYGNEFNGRRTANGELYNVQSLTAAHRTLPLPSWVKITNLRNNKSVIARVNDRGPFAKSRIIDVSQKVAEKLGFKNQGTTEVRVELLPKQTKNILQKLNINKNE